MFRPSFRAERHGNLRYGDAKAENNNGKDLGELKKDVKEAARHALERHFRPDTR
jgi:hypothetical protein